MPTSSSRKSISTLIHLWFEDTPNLLQAISAAIAQGDAIALQRAAHTLKSSSATLGAITLSQLSRELEAIGRTGTITDALAILRQAEAEYERAQAALQIERQAC